MPYYVSKDGKKLIDSSHKIDDDNLEQINELCYTIAGLFVKGYSRREIEEAVAYMFYAMKKSVAPKELEND